MQGDRDSGSISVCGLDFPEVSSLLVDIQGLVVGKWHAKRPKSLHYRIALGIPLVPLGVLKPHRRVAYHRVVSCTTGPTGDQRCGHDAEVEIISERNEPPLKRLHMRGLTDVQVALQVHGRRLSGLIAGKYAV